MALRKGKLIKLKDTKEYGWVESQVDDLVKIRKVGILERNSKVYEVKLENIKSIRMYYTKDVKDTLKEGDFVLCKPGDLDYIIYGKIGEKSEASFFLWNNTSQGGTGRKEIKGFKYSWNVNLMSEKSKILVLSEEIKVILRCFGCNEELENNEYKKGADDENYCDDCWEEKFYTCEECDEVIWQDDSLSSEGGDEILCEDCYNYKYVHCKGCNCALAKEGDDCYRAESEYWCSDCFHDRFSICGDCGDVSRTEDMHYDEEEDTCFCQECSNSNKSKDIHDYGYRPTPEFKKNKWEDELYLGIELEVLHDEYGKQSTKFLTFLDKIKAKERFYLKHDGSLDGEGFEIVSHPETLQSIHKNIKWLKILEWLTKNDFESEENGKCGIHIHINRAILEELDITKLRLFFKVNENKLIEFSKRGGESSFAKFDKKDIKAIIHGEQDSDRYNAINLNSSRETIELRLFKGSLNYERVLSILQFSDAIVRFVKKVGITCFLYGEGKYRKNSWGLFVDWCKEENRYKTLIKHLEKEKLVEVM